MKKALPFLFFILLPWTNFSQDYLPILEEDNVWHAWFYDSFGGGDLDILSDVYTVAGSTEINGKIYKSVFNHGSDSGCLVREENGVMYKYVPFIDDDVVWMDLNLEVNDVFVKDENEFCVGLPPIVFNELTVVNVSTQFIHGVDRKVLDLVWDTSDPSAYSEQWIEGIGTTAGFDPIGVIYDSEIELACFTKDGLTTYFNDLETCIPIASVDDFFVDQIAVSPNPVSEISVLNIPSEVFADHVTIYSLEGRLLKVVQVTSEAIYVHRSDFTSGLFFFQVFGEAGRLKTGTFIIR